MKQKRIDDYNHEVSQWVAKQDLLFQVIHGFRFFDSIGQSVKHFFGVLFKLALLLTMIGAAFFYFQFISFRTDRFASRMEEQIKRSFGADSVEMSSLKAGLWKPVSIYELKVVGGDTSSFEELELHNISLTTKVSNLHQDQIQLNSLSCGRMNVYPRLSKSEASDLPSLLQTLCAKNGWFDVQSISTKQFNCQWGYSRFTKGVIQKSKMSLQRTEDQVTIHLNGGEFSYRWWQQFGIESILIEISPDRFEIKECILHKRDAKLTFSGESDHSSLGVFSGAGRLRGCALKELLSPRYQKLLYGVVHTDFTVSGAVQRDEGLRFVFQNTEADLEEPSFLKFTNEIPLWRALTTVDSSSTYKNYKFNANSWQVIVKGDYIDVNNALLASKDNDRMQLALNFKIKEPSVAFLEALMQSSQLDIQEFIRASGLLSEAEIILKRKGNVFVNKRVYLEEEDYRQLFSNVRHIKGACEIKLHKGAFVSHETLQKAFPVTTNGMRILKVELDGSEQGITKSFVKELYALGRKK